jgi:anti-sigma regulatory factor (Ser/Thr protein kinase)
MHTAGGKASIPALPSAKALTQVMPISFRTVYRSKGNIRFGAKVNDKALRDFVPTVYEALDRGFRSMVLDFSQSDAAYADAVLPLICLLDHRRSRGDSFSVVLPEGIYLRQLFLNANWAHFMDPSHPKVDLAHPQHVPARRYVTHAEQQEAVHDVLDVVLRNMDLGRDLIRALEWSINEITDNVLNHAESPAGGLVQLDTFRDEQTIRFVVADAGRGIPAAMRAAFPQLKDVQAISEAVKAGVTSIPDSGQGNGLAGALRIASYASGSLKISSGQAQLNVYREVGSSQYRTKTTETPRGFRFPGTAVMMELSTAQEFDIREALELGAGVSTGLIDVVELKYTSEAGDLVMKLCDEALGTGTRHAGVELRRKCHNLLSAEPGKRLILDWGGVPLISSSFADEAVGKLFVELGPTAFSTRVSHTGAEPLVQSLLDRAVMQRVVQTMQSGGAGEAAP